MPFAGQIPFTLLHSCPTDSRCPSRVIDCLPAFNQLLITRLVVVATAAAAIVVGRVAVAVVAAIALKCPTDNTATSSSKHFSVQNVCYCFSLFRPSHFSLETALEILNNRIKISFVIVLAFDLPN